MGKVILFRQKYGGSLRYANWGILHKAGRGVAAAGLQKAAY